MLKEEWLIEREYLDYSSLWWSLGRKNTLQIVCLMMLYTRNLWKKCDSRMPTFKYLPRSMIMGPHWIWLFTIPGLCMSTYPPLSPPPPHKKFSEKVEYLGDPKLGGGGVIVCGFDIYINIHLWRFFPFEFAIALHMYTTIMMETIEQETNVCDIKISSNKLQYSKLTTVEIF